MIKKKLEFFLVIILLISLVPTVYATDFEQFLSVKERVSGTKADGSDLVTSGSAERPYVSFQRNNQMTFDVSLDGGTYTLYAHSSLPVSWTSEPAILNVEMAGQKKATSLLKTESWSDWAVTEIGDFAVSGGEYEIILENSGTAYHLNGITIKKKSDGLYATFEAENIKSSSGEIAILSNTQRTAMLPKETEWLEYDVNLPFSGYYMLSVNAATLKKSAMDLYINGSYSKRMEFIQGTAYENSICIFKADESISKIKFFIGKGNPYIDKFTVTYISDYTEEKANEFCQKINYAENAYETESIFKEYADDFSLDYEMVTDGIFYKTSIFSTIVGRNFTDAEEALNAIFESCAAERKSPRVALYKGSRKQTELADGDFKVKISGVSVADGLSMLCGVYSGGRLKYIGMAQNSDNGVCTIELPNITIDKNAEYETKIFSLETMESLSPLDAFCSIYKTIYVSETGDDSYDGSKEAPFRTLKRAKEEVAKINGSMTGDIIISIASGEYPLDETEVFDTSHSGKNGHRVIIKGENEDNPPLIHGGKKVTGWTKYTDKIYKAPLSGLEYVRKLYVNGNPAKRAGSEVKYTYSSEYYKSGSETADGFKILKSALPISFSKPSELELVWPLYWTEHRTPVSDIKTDSKNYIFEMKKPWFTLGSGTLKTTIGVNAQWKNNSFYIENAFELLDNPGEFYYDKQAGYIYYYPYAEEDLVSAKTYVGSVEKLFDISGESASAKVKNITFSNLDIRYGANNHVSREGLVSVQSDCFRTVEEKSQFRMFSQIEMKMADGIEFENCKISCLGSGAIAMTDGVTNTKITGNIIKDVSGGGVVVGTWNHNVIDNGEEMCSGIEISNNVIRRVADEYKTHVAISVYYEKNIDISYNDIGDVPYTAVSLGWGWGTNDNLSSGNITLSHNRIDNVMQTLEDGSHIYTLGTMKGSSIDYNYTTRSSYVLSGLYNDSGSGNIDIANNVFAGEEGTYWWYQGFNHTHDLTAHDNYSTSDMYRSAAADTDRENHGGEGTTLLRHTVVTDGNWPEKAVYIMQNAGVENEYKYLLSEAEKPEWRKNIFITN